MARFNHGWVKIHRRAMLGDINANFTRGGLFAALISMANIQESTIAWRGRPRRLDRGEIATSIKELSDLGETDRKTIEKHLNYLVLRGTIILEKSAQGTLIKILNFDFYQSHDADGGKRGPNAMANDMDNSMDNGVAHIEERKKERKKENTAIEIQKVWFEQLCKAYPVKLRGANAFERFCDQVRTEAEFAMMMLHLQRYRAHLAKNDWKRPKQSVATWLGTERSGYFWEQWDSDDAGTTEGAQGSLDDLAPLREKYNSRSAGA